MILIYMSIELGIELPPLIGSHVSAVVNISHSNSKTFSPCTLISFSVPETICFLNKR